MKNHFDDNISSMKKDIGMKKYWYKSCISDKLNPFYDPIPLKVSQTEGTMITAANDNDR